MAPYHRSDFLKAVKEAFPEVTQSINSQDGILHLEMSEFRRFAQSLIDSGREQELAKCFKVIERLERNASEKLRNAIDVSFVEDLDFSDTKKQSRSWAWRILPRSLQILYEQFHGTQDA